MAEASKEPVITKEGVEAGEMAFLDWEEWLRGLNECIIQGGRI